MKRRVGFCSRRAFSPSWSMCGTWRARRRPPRSWSFWPAGGPRSYVHPDYHAELRHAPGFRDLEHQPNASRCGSQTRGLPPWRCHPPMRGPRSMHSARDRQAIRCCGWSNLCCRATATSRSAICFICTLVRRDESRELAIRPVGHAFRPGVPCLPTRPAPPFASPLRSTREKLPKRMSAASATPSASTAGATSSVFCADL